MAKKKRKHDGKPIPVEQWGRDHLSTMLYIETRCVDYAGVPAAAHMRTWSGRPSRGDMKGIGYGHQEDYPSRLADGMELSDHDDWDCADDFEAAGLLEWQGTGMNPIFKLTDKGWEFAHNLRRQKAERTKTISLQEAFGQVA